MKKIVLLILAISTIIACQKPAEKSTEFEWKVDRFADVQILRYQIPGWEELTPKQRVYVYYLTQAGLAGRDIIWDQNYRHNLSIRKALEGIIEHYPGKRKGSDWDNFMTYAKRVFFSNGIHHHYSMMKFKPEFSQEYFEELMQKSGVSLDEEQLLAIFDPNVDPKKVNLDPEKGLISGSAVNFYASDLMDDEVEAFYQFQKENAENPLWSYGINSRMRRAEDGTLYEDVYKVGGLFGSALERMIHFLDLAASVAESDCQAEALRTLIQYYQTGELELWDVYNIQWTQCTEGDIDYIQGFVEVYNDPLGHKGSYESIVQIKDFEASKRMAMVEENVQWFEDNSPIMDEHKKKNVVGITYKVVTVAGEAGDASPSTPIGVNLPNADWIRKQYGSKSVSLGNLIAAYEAASSGGFLDEFGHDDEEKERVKAHGRLAGKLHTALHEVVGHASGQLNEGVGTPKETLKSYASTLEEARADLVALYFILDPKLIELGLVESKDVGLAEYDQYLLNGMMGQLRRLELGDNVEESHMRNRQLVCMWAYEKGMERNIIELVKRDGKTYININDYEGLRQLFGELLREIQRIKSEGDYEAGKNLVEGYGVQVNRELHKEVLDRSAKLDIAPYNGFVNPILVPVMSEGMVIDVEVKYEGSFIDQMLDYGKNHSFLPAKN